MTIKNWDEVIEEDFPDFKVDNNTLINTLRFAKFRGDIDPRYADRKIKEIEERKELKEDSNGFLRRAYDYFARWLR